GLDPELSGQEWGRVGRTSADWRNHFELALSLRVGIRLPVPSEPTARWPGFLSVSAPPQPRR
ncbi:MAG: hypothetical protein WB801_10980, partial [Candidatus Dormiibacterota bacterium]